MHSCLTASSLAPARLLQVIGQAFGNAAMILASGKKGYRYALPNSRIMTCPPRMNRCAGVGCAGTTAAAGRLVALFQTGHSMCALPSGRLARPAT